MDEVRDVLSVADEALEHVDAQRAAGGIRGLAHVGGPCGETALVVDVGEIVEAGARRVRLADSITLYLREGTVAPTVLICDDAIFMRTMVGDILQQAGFEVVGEAETGAQAVEKYKQLRPDLVTMDIVMPDMGGIDAVREITKFDPDAKMLMCSAMGQQALVVEAIQAGAKDFVVKPFQPSRVLEAVQRVLG